jgi:hypothetical protein
MPGQKGFWTELNPKNSPSQRDNFGMCDIGDEKIIIFGGDEYATSITLDETWLYDYKENKWTQITTEPKPSKRERMNLAKLTKNKVLLFGGSLNFNAYGDTWIFDLETMKWQEMKPESYPAARDKYSFSQIAENKVLLFSGIVDPYYNGETWLYDYEKNEWKLMIGAFTSKDRPPENEGGIMAMLDTGKVLFYGGWQFGLLGETWLYDLNSNLWKELNLDSIPPPISSSSMVNLIKNKVIFWGGDPAYNDKLYDEAWIFDLNKFSWHLLTVDKKPIDRYLHKIAKIEDNKIFMFGGIEYNILLNDSWLLTVNLEDSKDEIIYNNDLTLKYYQSNRNELVIKYELNMAAVVNFNLININGSILRNIITGYQTEGKYEQIIDISHLSSGVYFINISAGIIRKQVKLLILK